MRLALAVLLIASACVAGCARAQTYPQLAPARMYGQGQHLNGQQPVDVQQENEAPAPSSSDYDIPNPNSEPASRENPLGPVAPRTNSKHRYLIQEALALHAHGPV